MPPPVDALVVALYFGVLACLAAYWAHRAYLVYLYTTRRSRSASRSAQAGLASAVLPRVTVQLPVYNEMYVVERLIDAVGRLRYPRDRLDVQVLDDSTDETSRIVDQAVRRWRERGLAIACLRRPARTGFKAGALAAGLDAARGELIAIFDADFVPPPGFLERAVPLFQDAEVGMVQARWGHRNRHDSLLTRVQALLLDAHFLLEHGARHRGGCFFNFNGTAGVWRRAAIVSAGGWQHDTLTEDLDLSYRAQLAGWRFVFVPDVVAPAELPVEMNAFKSQQHRWAKGSIQTCRKLLPRLLRAPVPFRVRVESVFHLTANLNYLLVLAWAALVVPALFARASAGGWWLWLDAPIFAAAGLAAALFYTLSQREVGGNWLARARDIPALAAVGLGMSVNNALAVAGALTGRPGGFARTAKYGPLAASGAWTGARYRQVAVVQPLVELACGVYFTVAAGCALALGVLAPVPVLVLCQLGFFYAGCLSLAQQRARAGAAWQPEGAGGNAP
ncbi:MAG: glycosyltransferase [Acidobacteria bacterium]|nr:glycosyltransferase [Acidobacteriota bacterium]